MASNKPRTDWERCRFAWLTGDVCQRTVAGCWLYDDVIMMNEREQEAGRRATQPRVGAVIGVGYEGKSLDDVVGLLTSEGVEVVVDVRLNAISRKPGLSKTALSSRLASDGIEYVHEPSLGNPKENRESFRSGDPAARRAYVSVLEGGAADAVDRVLVLARKRTVALLCFEADEATCHRSSISAWLGSMDPGLVVL